jgi:hypothetical protein
VAFNTFSTNKTGSFRSFNNVSVALSIPTLSPAMVGEKTHCSSEYLLGLIYIYFYLPPVSDQGGVKSKIPVNLAIRANQLANHKY